MGPWGRGIHPPLLSVFIERMLVIKINLCFITSMKCNIQLLRKGREKIKTQINL